MKSTNLLRLLFLLLYAGAGMTQCRQKSETSLFCVPNHFVGDVLIVFDQPAGAPVEYRGNARLYRIPATGVLRTRFKPDYGWHQPDQFYYVDAQGEFVKKLPYFDTVPVGASDYQPSDTIALHAIPFKDATQKIHCLSFILGPMEDSEALHEARENTFRHFK